MNNRNKSLKCATWLSQCLSFGWEKESIPALEKLWNDHHDEKGDILPHLPKSTENLSKIADKDEWLNEVRGNELHPDTENLLKTCFEELRLKLIKNQKKYGWSNEWLIREWEQECREQMMKHIEKGDPRDVAIYAMFMIYRGWSTVVEVSKKPISEDELKEKFKYAITWMGSDLYGKVENCAQIAKQYSDSKLSELEKWIDEQFKHADSLDKQDDTVTRYFSGKKDGLSLIKIKLQSLKQ